MNTEELKLVCPKCGEELTNAEKIKIIDKIDSFRNTEKYKEDIKDLERNILKIEDEINISDSKTAEYIKNLYDLNDDNSEEAENKKSMHKEMIIQNQMDIQKNKEVLVDMKKHIEELKSEIVKINNRFDIKEFFNTTNVLCADNDYADFKELVKDNSDTIRFRAKLSFLESEYEDKQTVYEKFLSEYHLSAMFSSANKNSYIIFYEFKKQKPDKIKTGIRYGKEDANVLTEIENWLNDIDTPEDKDNYKFLLIPSENIDYKSLYPYHYAPKYSTVKEYLQGKDTVRLSEIAQIIIPECDYNEKGDVLKTDEEYSGISGVFDALKNKLGMMDFPCENEFITDCLLQKDDIVITGNNDFTFISEEPLNDIYANGYNHIVLRSTSGFPAEYLYNYLIGNIGYFLMKKIIQNDFDLEERSEDFLAKLKDIPVIVPKNGETDFDCCEFNETVNKFAKV